MSWTYERARIASLTRSRTANDPELIQAKENLKRIRFEQKIHDLLASVQLSQTDLDSLAEKVRTSLVSGDAR